MGVSSLLTLFRICSKLQFLRKVSYSGRTGRANGGTDRPAGVEGVPRIARYDDGRLIQGSVTSAPETIRVSDLLPLNVWMHQVLTLKGPR